MAIKKLLDGIFGLDSGKPRVRKMNLRIKSFTDVSEVPKILKLAEKSPLLILSVKEFRERDKDGFKEGLVELKDKGAGLTLKFLNEDWIIVLGSNTELAKPEE